MREKGVFTRDAYTGVHASATAGGKKSATHQAEERARNNEGLDPLVDPKGPSHLGPIRRSLPRFDREGNVWVLPRGIPMAEETLLDTTGSMGDNVDIALQVLPRSYEMMAKGSKPVLGRYDPQIATAIFNDVQDPSRIPVLCRTQFEMDEKIAVQMTRLVPGREGQGNGKEDSQFGLFGATYLTVAGINKYGLKYYHFTVSDEPVVEIIDLAWLKRIYGNDVLDRVRETGHDFNADNLPDTQQAVQGLQKNAHAFFLQVGDRSDVQRQWRNLYGSEHFVMLPSGTKYLHCVKAAIIGLTEGVLDLSSIGDFLREAEVSASEARIIAKVVAHIPLGAQTLFPNFSKLPKAGDHFKEKTDLWPISEQEQKPIKEKRPKKGPRWL